jgi:hypothetical protein
MIDKLHTKFKSSAQFVIAQKGHLLKKQVTSDAKRFSFAASCCLRDKQSRARRDCIE